MEKYLIDTHVLIWMAQQPENIPPLAKAILESENEILLSYVCVWEIAIKVRTKKLEIQLELPDYINSSVQKYGFQLFPITLNHIYHTFHLELYHRYPFDRLLIAQSVFEDTPIISSDEIFDSYGVKRIWK